MERLLTEEAASPAAELPGGTGRVEALWVKRQRLRPTEPVAEAVVTAGHGIGGNVRQGRRRQVTFITREAWTAMMHELNADVDPAMRRANVLLSGIDLRDCRGKMLEIGGLRFELAGETKPCERMDEAFPGLRAAMRPAWRGGAFAMALDDGVIRVGDSVVLRDREVNDA